jgi:hypothetical protein
VSEKESSEAPAKPPSVEEEEDEEEGEEGEGEEGSVVGVVKRSEVTFQVVGPKTKAGRKIKGVQVPTDTERTQPRREGKGSLA